jgi:hypothetical protein
VSVDENVFWFDIAVNHSLAVDMVESGEELGKDVKAIWDGKHADFLLKF